MGIMNLAVRQYAAAFLLIGLVISAASGFGSFQYEVTLSTRVDPRQVPLNRSCQYTIEVSWEGDTDEVEIGPVEEPAMTNLEIIGKSASHRIIETKTGRRVFKTIEYTLMPVSPGMAHIEPAELPYTEKSTGKVLTVRTDRIAVEVIKPVHEPERSLKRWIFPGISVLFVGGVLFLWFRKPSRKKRTAEEPRLLEEIFLDELKQNIRLKDPDRNESFTRLSRLFRLYLSKKYRISTLESTSEALIASLKEQGADDEMVNRCRHVLTMADRFKFSGRQASRAELEETYTLVETMFASILGQARTAVREREQSEKKTKQAKQPA
ncbi:MAG TPA: hypothetical protein ENN03_01935 [bacterium]|nr:hypothetical protein [bacterium]